MDVLRMMYIVIFGIIWLALAFWPARVAARKGHSFFAYFFLSLLFFPLSLILAYASHDRMKDLPVAPAAPVNEEV